MDQNTAIDVYGVSKKIATYGIDFRYLKAVESEIGADIFPHILEFVVRQNPNYELFKINDKSEQLTHWKTKVNKKKDYYLLTKFNEKEDKHDWLGTIQHNWHPEPQTVYRHFYDDRKFSFLEARGSIDDPARLDLYEKQGRVIKLPVQYQKMFEPGLYKFSLRAIDGVEKEVIDDLHENIQLRYFGAIIDS